MKSARVIIVDDQPGTAAGALVNELDRIGVIANALKPDEVEEGELIRADLVLVDYKLDKWSVATEASADVATSPRDGLALAAVFASRLRGDERIRGIALYSAELEMLVQDFSSEVTEHAAARINGIDWAFQKDEIEDLPPNAERVAEFARSVQGLGSLWADEEIDPRDALRRFLELPADSWAEVAMRDVLAAQPPIHQFAESSKGVTVLRWLAQRILPYPTFLMDRAQLAVACGVTPASIADLEPSVLGKAFDNGSYRGALANFLGPRWWRAAVRRRLREETGSSSGSAAAAKWLAEAVGEELDPLDPITSVLAMDETLKQPHGLISRERAVRVRPDDWPIFAEPAWVNEELVRKEAALRSFVEPSDLARIGGET